MIRLLNLVALCVVCVSQVFAEPVSGLYESIIKVADESPEARAAAINRSLANVMLKVSGRQSEQLARKLKADQKLLGSYIQEYRYLPLDETPDAAASKASLLKVVFDKRGINNWLKQQQLPLWSEQRPVVLLWSATQVNGKRSLDIAEFDTVLTGVSETVAKQRGVPFILPLMDLQDRNMLSVSDVWGEFDDKLKQASDRYNADVIATVRLTQIAKGQWQAHWREFIAGATQQWSNSGSSRLSALRKGLNELADRLAMQFASVTNQSGENNGQLIQVDGIYTMSHYNRLMKFLQSRNSIAAIAINKVEGDSLLLSLSLKSNIDSLVNDLRLGGMLSEIEHSAVPAVVTTDKVNKTGVVADTPIDASILYYQLEL